MQGKRTHIFPNRYFQLFRTHLPGLRLEPLRFNPVLDLLLLLGLHPLCGTSYCTIFQIDSSFSFSQFPPTRNGQLVNANRLTLAQNCNKQATQERSLFLHKTEALIPFGHCSCTIIVKKKLKCVTYWIAVLANKGLEKKTHTSQACFSVGFFLWTPNLEGSKTSSLSLHIKCYTLLWTKQNFQSPFYSRASFSKQSAAANHTFPPYPLSFQSSRSEIIATLDLSQLNLKCAIQRIWNTNFFSTTFHTSFLHHCLS